MKKLIPSIFAAGLDLSQDTLEQLLSQTRSSVVLTDPNQPDNPIVACNAAFEHLSGYDRTEILGRNCRFLQGPDTRPEDVLQITECLSREGSGEFELRNYRKDGTPF